MGSEFYAEFQDIWVEPLLEMFNYSLENDTLPPLQEANISLLLKKGKPPEECASYKPISLLNTDFKFYPKFSLQDLKTYYPSSSEKIRLALLKDIVPVIIFIDY